jgi:hypothetical protein
MKIKLWMKSLCGCVIFLAILPARGAAQSPAPQAPAAQPPSVCANQPMCAEGYDFAAMITDFRTSDVNGLKVIDTTVHFVNKTNRPLILGYTDGSGMAIDDQGNRYGINGYAGPNAVRGIGKVVGNQIDAKFVLQPGQGGDALFELLWRPSGGAVGQSFEFDFTVREANAVEGGQFTLGGEFPLRFMGLTNGVGAKPAGGTSYAPAGGALTAAPPAGGAYPAAGGMTATPPAGGAYSAVANAVSGASASTAAGCTPSGGLTAVNQAAGNLPAGAQSSVSQAQATVANFRSMFGKKKAAAAPAPAAGTPCAPGTPVAAPAAVPVAATAPSPAYVVAPTAGTPAAATAPAISTPAPTANAAMTPAQRVEAVRRAQAQAQAQQRAAQIKAAQEKAAAEAAAKKKAAASTAK